MFAKKIELCLLDPEWKFGVSANLYKKYKKEISYLENSCSVPLNMINYSHICPYYEGPKVSIIEEDEDFLVLEKPAGVHCHPLSYLESDNILSFLRQEGRGDLLSNVNPSSYDRGLLYRLDYETSGLLIYVKRQDLWQDLRDHFLKVAKEKKYQAFVRGEFPEKEEGLHSYFYEAFGPKGHKMRIKDDPNLHLGKMRIKKIHFDKELNRTLLEIHLETGLRHQIRCTLAHLSFPIIGDLLYGGEKAERLYLHAQFYSLFLKEKGKRRDFTSLLHF